MDLSFPIKDHLSEDNFKQLLEVARNYNASKFKQAKELIAELLSKLDDTQKDEQAIITRAIFTHWSAKIAFTSGDFLQAYQHAQSIAKFVKPALDSQEGQEKNTNLIHWLLKAQVYSARCLNKIKDITKAEAVCEDVIRFIEEYKEKGGETQSFMYQAVKAHYMRAKNMMNVMEYKAAKKILEEEAKPLLQALIEKFTPMEAWEERNPTLDLPYGRYSFQYRKKYVLYLKKFAFY
jgi:hypothetical protein